MQVLQYSISALLIEAVTIFLFSTIILVSSGLVMRRVKGTENCRKQGKRAAVANILIIFSLSSFLYALVTRLIPALILSLFICFFLVIAHSQKMQRLKEPLFPWDFLWHREFFAIPWLSDQKMKDSSITLLVFVAVCGIAFIMSWHLEFIQPNSVARYILAFWSIIFISSLFWIATDIHPTGPVSLFDKLRMKLRYLVALPNVYWDQLENYTVNGFFLATIYNLPGLFISRPPHYSAESLDKVYKLLTVDATITPRKTLTEANPNLVMIMLESFFDPTLLPIKLNQDPTPFFRSLREFSSFGVMRSPSYGGLTANAEFEVLTGLSMACLPRGSIPYRQYINRPLVTALPFIFNAFEYRTISLQPFPDWFWNQNRVYPLLGFQENFWLPHFVGARMTGNWVSDEAIVDKIIDMSTPSEKLFIFAITASTHWPWPEGYSNNQGRHLEVVDLRSALSLKTEELNTYVNLLCDADAALHKLVKHFSELERPSVIALFGDHLPALTGLPQVCDQHSINPFSVPLIIWKNFDNRPQEINCRASELGNVLLHDVGLQSLRSRCFAGNLAPTAQCQIELDHSFCSGDRSGVLLQGPTSGGDSYSRLLAYDILVGKQYFYESLTRNERAGQLLAES
jgi:phosphoglycerol transferase MdoB-like AlkP superfamily enzyme